MFSPSLQEVPSSVSLLLPLKQLVLPLHMRLSMQPPPSPFSSLRCLFGYGRILFGRIPHRPACNETHQTVWIPHFSRYGQNVELSLDFNSRNLVIQPPAEKQYSEYFLYFLSAQPPAKVNSCIIFDPALRIYLLCILLPYFSQSKTPISKPINRRPALLQNMLQRRVRLQRQPQRPFARPIQMPRIP